MSKKITRNPKFSAVAFDLDGTLYPNYRFYARLLPFVVKEQRYLRAFGKARNRLRAELSPEGDTGLPFYTRQAHYMGEILKSDPAALRERNERLIYRGWEPLFKNIKIFPHVIDILNRFRERGIKLGLLSDFPPQTKLEYLGLSGFWDTVLCSETIGRLKPDVLPFRELAGAMSLPPEEILYVGNSFSYDVKGAQKAGMKAAWICSPPQWLKHRIFPRNGQKADFVFYDYRQLRDYVLI